MKAPELLNKAAGHMADRAATYDKPEGERSMLATVTAFNAITGHDLTEAEGWLLLQVLKDVRLWQRPGYHADSAEDCIAYAALKAEAKAGEVIAVDPLATGWKRWDGGSCPVEPKTIVHLRYRNGVEVRGQAWAFDWHHTNSDGDIIAYRVPEVQP